MSGAGSNRTRAVLDRIAARLLDASVGERIAIAAASMTLALLIGLVVVAFAGYDPVQFLGNVAVGAFGDANALARTLKFTTLFILTGVAVAIAFRAGVFNIGVQGQFVVGGFATVIAILQLAPFLPTGATGGVLLMVLGTVAGVIAGGAYGALPGILKAYGDANEIVTTIMLNFIATGAVGYLVDGPFRGEGNRAPNTARIPEYVSLPRVVFDVPDFSVVGLAVTLVVVAAIAWVLARTRFGYDMVTSGHQIAAATFSGVNAKRTVVATMTLSGMVAGIAGALFAIMIQGYYSDPAGIGTYGFDAIAVSLLAANNPLGVVPAGFLFGALDSAGSHIRINSDVPVQLIDGIIGLVVLFVAVPELFRMAAERTGLGGEN
ncbi:inner-membrane translocator [Haloarcula japonica DSM 6131]|uniref:Inner-membrane translocator n=1 Tax=Haloarcula japonica (strain ATCC 49778 / DSM 6131 / JCM 7785 / NBRC 101032 / NCIMB 13157 / TR-1) TaxID=1227453 RepID=M0L2C9_HALJT|nr:ABC transporter permease [Haloarcula japonica]EMA27701.1 inner-membrane translocator [Haloarcula japonica DSM 6131]